MSRIRLQRVPLFISLAFLVVLAGVLPAPAAEGAPFKRSDSNQDDFVDISDAVNILNFLFQGSARLDCLDAADSNDDGQLDISDAVHVLGWLFLGGDAPPEPGPFNCGPDPTIDADGKDLGCLNYPPEHCGIIEPPEPGRLLGGAVSPESLIRYHLPTLEPTILTGRGMGRHRRVGGLDFDPNGNRLFATDTIHYELIVIDTTTGTGTTIGSYGDAYGIEGLAYDPDLNVLYGSDINSSQLVTLDTSTGAVTPVGPLGLSDVVLGLAFDPNTDTLYGVGSPSDQLLTIDTATGAATPVGALGFSSVQCLAFDPNTNTLYGAPSNRAELLSINASTGAATSVGSFNAAPFLSGMAFDRNTNRLWGAQSIADRIGWIDTAAVTITPVGALEFGGAGELSGSPIPGTFLGINGDDQPIRIDRATGVASVIGNIGERCQGLAYDSASGVLYSNRSGGGGHLITIDPATGAAETPLPSPLGFSSVESLAWDPGTKTLYGVSNQSRELITIDTTTGAGAAVGPLGITRNVGGLAFDAASGVLYATTATFPSQLLTIDISTGAATALGPLAQFGLVGLAYDPGSGGIYGASENTLFRIDPATLFSHPIGALGYTIHGLDYDPQAEVLLAVDRQRSLLFSIDPSTAAVEVLARISAGAVEGLAYDPDTGTLYASDVTGNQLLTIDRSTGAARPQWGRWLRPAP